MWKSSRASRSISLGVWSRAASRASRSFWRRNTSTSCWAAATWWRCDQYERIGNTTTNRIATSASAISAMRAGRVSRSATALMRTACEPASPGERARAEVLRAVAELFFDAQQLVVLRDPFAARGRAGLDLTAVRRDREIGDDVSSVSPLRCDITTVYPDRVASPTVSSVSVSEPIWFTLTRIEFAIPCSIPRRESLDVGDEQVVADELHARADTLRQRRPAVPVVFGHAVFDRHDRVARAEVGEIVGELGRRERAVLAGEHVLAVLEELARRGVDRERDLVARRVARALDRVNKQLQRFLVRREIGREAAFVAEPGRELALLQQPRAARGRSPRPSAAPRRSSPRRRARA